MYANGFIYQIERNDTKEVVIAGITSNSEATICPAQIEPYLLDEFPSLPFECEMHKFKVPGLTLKVEQFTLDTEDYF